MYEIAVVAEQPIWRAGLERLAEQSPGLAVGKTSAGVDELRGRFDLVVLDVPRPTPDIGHLIAATLPHGPVLIVAERPSHHSLTEAIVAGARGWVSRETEQRAVREAIRVTVGGGFYLCERLAGHLAEELAEKPGAARPGTLGPREAETLRWIAAGYTHSQIATRMGLSHATVNTYAKRIRAKLDAGNKAELTRRAIELGHV